MSTALTSEILDRQPPCNLEAEQCVLGSIMLLPDACDEVALILHSMDFYDDGHRTLYEHMLAMHDAGRKIDIPLLVERLKSQNDFDAVGGAAYLETLFNSVPHAAHAKFYAEIVHKKATYRSLIDASTDILRDAYEESDDAREMLGKAEQRIFSILDSRAAGNVATIDDLMQDALERLDARMRGESTTGGVDTGFADIDELLNGFHNSQLIVLAARPGMGKTALAMNFTEHVTLKARVPVLYVSLEMSTMELADRMLCSVANVNSHRLRSGTLSSDDRRRLVETAADMSSAPMFIDDTPSRNVTEIAAAARRIRRRNDGLGLIVVDYLQLVQPDSTKDPRQEQVAKITRRLKLIARDLNVPVLCLAQLNRQAEEGRGARPKLSHLRESGAIEQDADVVMFIHRPDSETDAEDDRQSDGSDAELIIAKQRNGPVGIAQLTWRKEFTRFGDRARPYQEDFVDYNKGESF